MSEASNARLPERLARVRKAADEAKAKREAQQACSHAHDNVEIKAVGRNGAERVYRGCSDCGRPVEGGKWLKGRNGADLPTVIDDRMSNPPCVRCGAFGTELHHFAPRALFGPEEAELWPTAWLCVTPDGGCHAYWHRVMAGASYQPALGEVM